MIKKVSLSLSNIKHSYNDSDFILNDINLEFRNENLEL